MRNFALVIAVALFAFAAPARSGPPHCYNTVNTICPVVGATMVCHDACNYLVRCVCRSGVVPTWSCGVMC